VNGEFALPLSSRQLEITCAAKLKVNDFNTKQTPESHSSFTEQSRTSMARPHSGGIRPKWWRLSVYAIVQCLFVRPSVTRWYCLETAEPSMMIIQDSPKTLVSEIQRCCGNLKDITPAKQLLTIPPFLAAITIIRHDVTNHMRIWLKPVRLLRWLSGNSQSELSHPAIRVMTTNYTFSGLRPN